MTEHKQIYDEKTFLMSILFGPMLVFFGLAGNYRRMGNVGAAVLVWVVGVIVAVAFISVFYLFFSAMLTNWQFNIVLHLIFAIFGLNYYLIFQKSQLLGTPGYGFMHLIGAGVVMTLVFYAVFIILLLALFGYEKLTGQAPVASGVAAPQETVTTVTKCFDIYSNTTEETDADHIKNMMQLKRCAQADTSADSVKLQNCTQQALDDYQIDPDGVMHNRKTVDADFIRCLSKE